MNEGPFKYDASGEQPVSMRTGGIVQKTGPVKVHAGEKVMTAVSTKPAANPVTGSTKSAGIPGSLVSLKKGGTVKKTGIFKLHAGERVIPKDKVMELSHEGLSGKAKNPKKSKIVKAAFREIKKNPPAILAKTARKSGAAQAERQRIAIGLSKARAAGAKVPPPKK